MKSVRIYIPAKRAQEPMVKGALLPVVSGGATLYPATGIWASGKGSGMEIEGVLVVEVLDCDTQRLEAVDRLATALLDAGEETVLIARQETSPRFLVRSGEVPMIAHS